MSKSKLFIFISIYLFTIILAKKKVAILGGGMGACTLSYYLKEMSGDAFNVTVFENSDSLFGQLKKFSLTNDINDVVELTNRAIDERDFLLHKAMVKFGLPHKQQRATQNIAIWNGEEIVLTQTGSSILDPVKLMYRYRIFKALMSMKNLVQRTAASSFKLYAQPIMDVKKFVNENNMQYNLANNFTSNLSDIGMPESFIQELFAGNVRSALYQNSSYVNSFAGAFSMLGHNNSVIVGGNDLLAREFLQRSGAKAYTATVVNKIEKRANVYAIHLNSSSNQTQRVEEFDYVILASQIMTQKVDMAFVPSDVLRLARSVRYNSVCSMIVQGELNNQYFNWDGQLSDLIETTENSTLSYYSIEKLNSTKGSFYKVVATECLVDKNVSGTYIQKMFQRNFTILSASEWKAYPEMKPRKEFAPVNLDGNNLYYLNALDVIVPTMEVEAIASLNIAKFILSQEKITEQMINIYEENVEQEAISTSEIKSGARNPSIGEKDL